MWFIPVYIYIYIVSLVRVGEGHLVKVFGNYVTASTEVLLSELLDTDIAKVKCPGWSNC